MDPPSRWAPRIHGDERTRATWEPPVTARRASRPDIARTRPRHLDFRTRTSIYVSAVVILPLLVFVLFVRAYLANRKQWDKPREEALTRECQQEIDAAIERYLATPPRAPQSMFDHLYAELPAVYAGQRRELAGGSDA